MTDSVPYGLTLEQLDAAPSAARAVAARLSHIVIDTEWWGRVEIAHLFLNMAIFAAEPRSETMRKMYHRVCRPMFETPLFEGLDALDLDNMPTSQRDAVQLVREFRAWRIEEDGRRKSRGIL